ncbi:MAG: hypothetical protein QM289_01530 [Bacillota bacterium]|nr:hypothetical protein [Bacillota bacterium]HOA42982.1 hypothetical protein [Bacillota bacterium]HPZ59234.1 hypothetical protein [Bacillota bacterium]HQC81967.1 hypothetical protein [Bacillota bacterium]
MKMNIEKTKKTICYPEIICAAEMSCTLCGKHNSQRFKHGYICEECLVYVKTQS